MKQLIYAAYFLCILFATGSHAASFDCTKASTLVEKTICSDAKLSELDSQLMQSYKKALASSPDASGVKSAQREWLSGVRNKCTDAACLNRVYTDRLKVLAVSETPKNWPPVNSAALIGKVASYITSDATERSRYSKLVGKNTELDDDLTATIFSDEDASAIQDAGEYLAIVSKGIIRRDTGPMDGAYVIHKASGKPAAILVKDSKFIVVGTTMQTLPPPLQSWAAERGAEFETPTLSKESASSSVSDTNKSPVEIALAKNAAKISALGFSNKWLKAPIYLRGDAVNPPNHFVVFENLLAMLFENPRFSKITAIKSGKFEGFRLKVKGAESSGLLFRFDEGDLFISHVVGGDDELTPLETAMDYVSLSMLVVQLAPDAIQRVK